MKYKITYRHNGYGVLFIDNTPWEVTYEPGTPYKIKCCNANCNGEYNLAELDLSLQHAFLICRGTEGSPQRRRIYRRCANSLECWITGLSDRDEPAAER